MKLEAKSLVKLLRTASRFQQVLFIYLPNGLQLLLELEARLELPKHSSRGFARTTRDCEDPLYKSSAVLPATKP